MIIRYFFLLLAAAFAAGCSSNPGGNSQAIASGNVSLANTPVVPGNPSGNVAPPSDGRPLLHFEPAPENSQIAQAKNSAGQMYEYRLWKGDKRLLKVESTTLDEKNKALTIVLRTAKVFNLTTDRIPNVKLATAKQFLDLVDAQTGAASPDPKLDQKKTE